MCNELLILCQEVSGNTGYSIENLIEFTEGLLNKNIGKDKVIEELRCIY